MSENQFQVFISSASNDNEKPPFDDRAQGFVTFFSQQLAWELTNLGELNTNIFFDEKIGNPGNEIYPPVQRKIADSSIFLIVLSPSWIASSWCRKEFETFVVECSRSGEDVLRRIVVVKKRPIDAQTLPDLLQEKEGFAFYTRSDPDDVTPVHEFYSRGAVQDKTEYFDVLSRLADHIYSTIKHIADSSRQVADIAAKIAKSAPPEPLPTTPELDRTKPEYWLHRVAIEHKLSPGDQPVVLVSFASEDQGWMDELHAFLELRIGELRDSDGRPYQLWNFSDANVGTTPGDEFPEIVAEKMWRCRAAVIVLNKDYFRSQYCRYIELPFLMWRWERHKLMCLPVKVGMVPIDKVRLPRYEGVSRSIVLNDIIDDRQAAMDFSNSRYRDLNLKELKEEKLEAEIEKRFDGVSRRVEDFLKKRYGARDED